MPELSKSISFEEWVCHVFDHPVSDPQWYFDADAPDWDGPRKVALEYVTRLCEDPVPVLGAYADAQINQGFWYLVGNSASNYMYVLTDPVLPLGDRLRCLNSFECVFRKLFAPRCTPHLGHLNEGTQESLNSICYMWWDIIPILGVQPENLRRKIAHAAIDVLDRILGISAIACQESALHGLAHWHHYYHAETESVIDRFLRERRRLRPELITYAKAARSGGVQ